MSIFVWSEESGCSWIQPCFFSRTCVVMDAGSTWGERYSDQALPRLDSSTEISGLVFSETLAETQYEAGTQYHAICLRLTTTHVCSAAGQIFATKWPGIFLPSGKDPTCLLLPRAEMVATLECIYIGTSPGRVGGRYLPTVPRTVPAGKTWQDPCCYVLFGSFPGTCSRRTQCFCPAPSGLQRSQTHR